MHIIKSECSLASLCAFEQATLGSFPGETLKHTRRGGAAMRHDKTQFKGSGGLTSEVLVISLCWRVGPKWNESRMIAM